MVIGGASAISGMGERIARDLRRECEVDSEINVRTSSVGWKGAYLGMKAITKLHI